MSAPHTWPNTLPGNSNLHTGGVRTPALAQCDHMVVIRAEGEEAGQYLQGQLTCDLAGIDNGQHHTALHLSLKGRGLASLRLARAGDGYVLVSPAAQAQAAIQCLEKYRLRAKITFQVAPRLHVHQLAGRIEAALASAGLPVPAPGQVATATNGTMIWRYPHTDHALLIGHTDSTAQWQALAAGRTVTDGSGARFQDVLAGEAQLYPGAQDLFLPQMLNFDVLGGVSFKKGCYTGQEVVARMHFKGRLKQRMQAFEHDGEPLKPGETVRDGKGRAVGDVVDGAAGEPRPVALVVVRLDHDGELYHQERPLRAQRLPLPYALPKPKTA